MKSSNVSVMVGVPGVDEIGVAAGTGEDGVDSRPTASDADVDGVDGVAGAGNCVEVATGTAETGDMTASDAGVDGVDGVDSSPTASAADNGCKQ